MQHLINDLWLFARTKDGVLPAADQFQPVSLPHDWLIGQADALYEDGDGWYVRNLYVENASDGLCRSLRFDGVYMDCEVLVNGKTACVHRYGYTAFDVELDGFLYAGMNEILVHVRFRSPNSRWYSGAGIYRDVIYREQPACHIAPDGIYVHTERRADHWLMRVDTEIVGDREGMPLVHRLIDADGSCIAEGEAELKVVSPRLWSPDEPVFYTLESELCGEIIRQRVGFREIRMEPETGLYINGGCVKLHGVCLHHDLGALGAAFYEKAARRQLLLMKRMGVNALRTAHNPPARQIMDLCDELGILVVSEAFDMWEKPKTEWDYARFFPECAEEDVRSWVRRDRNHPSLLMWSIGNEIVDTHIDARGQELTRWLAGEVRRHDPAGNGAVTIGLNYLPWENAQKCVDILKNGGYNYAEKLYAEHHAKYPDWVIYGSETGSLVSSRGVYHFPIDAPILSEVDLQCSSLGNSKTSWGTQDIRRMVTDDLNTPYSMGQFLWSGIDYIGEPTPYHTRSSYFGFADTAGFPKDLYYFMQAAWSREPVLHIGVHWDWNEGQLIDVNVMTNAWEAELLLNGRSLGRRRVSFADAENALPCWRVPFKQGELTAKAYNAAGECIAEETRRTPGDSRRLVLRAEDAALLGDGQDMVFIEISAEDEAGRPVDTACDRVRITVRGQGRLLGLDNGDSTDRDGYFTDTRRLFMGKLLAIAGGAVGEGEMIVEAAAPGLESAEVCLKVLSADREKGRTAPPGCPRDERAEGIHARRIELTALGDTHLNPGRREVCFSWRMLPECAMKQEITWQLTNAAGIETACAELTVEESEVRVRALGDGTVYLRAMCNNGYDHPRVLSQREIFIEGLGLPNLDPYSFIAGGLYDVSMGAITPGNEKGVAFARDGVSRAGFTRVNFGPDGSDRITLPVFALDGGKYDIRMYLGDPEDGGELIAVLPYQKSSRWNVYQPESYTLPRRIRGVQTIVFELDRKIHLKGFSFDRQSRAFMEVKAGEADAVYGDSFTRCEDAVLGIGNNVTLVFERMDFGKSRETVLALRGKTPLEKTTVTVRIRNEDGLEETGALEYPGGCAEAMFPMRTPGGRCSVSFVFLPGAQFDFEGFCFSACPEGD